MKIVIISKVNKTKSKARKMARQLKRWESPRKEGRNDKGRGGSARARQLKKQQQMLRKKLKEQSEDQKPNQNQKLNKKNAEGGEVNFLPLFYQDLHKKVRCCALARRQPKNVTCMNIIDFPQNRSGNFY